MYISCNNKATSKELNPQVFENDSSAKENSLVGCLHGESITRKDNFDSIREVTSDNIEKLYSLYDVKSVGVENTILLNQRNYIVMQDIFRE